MQIQKFRKKPVIIEAVQLLKDQASLHKVECFIEGKQIDTGSSSSASDAWDNYWNIVIHDGGRKIFTKEGVMLASFGDWVIKGVNGEFYPCKPDIFEKTYEPVED